MAGIDGFGTELQRGDGVTPTEVFTALANVTSIKGPGIKRDTIDVTAHDSANAYMEFVGSLKDGGEVDVDVNYDPAKHDTLIADFDDENPRNYQLVFPDQAATTWTFKAILTEFQPEAPYDDKLAASLKFKVSGKPTLT